VRSPIPYYNSGGSSSVQSNKYIIVAIVVLFINTRLGAIDKSDPRTRARRMTARARAEEYACYSRMGASGLIA
jgi:hypothetical protein